MGSPPGGRFAREGMGKDGQDVGSSIDIRAYMNGDFDGDGQRDFTPIAASHLLEVPE